MGSRFGGECVLSEDSFKWGALQAVMAAAHDPLGHAGQQHADPVQPSLDVAQSGGVTEQRYAALLARLLVGEQTQLPHRVLFVAACTRTRSTPIALGVTRAAAALLGRSLLIDGWSALQDGHQSAADSAAEAGNATHRLLPDSFVPRLHHYRVSSCGADSTLLFRQSHDDLLATLGASFRFVAIDASPPSSGPVANALAGSCAGCVVVVGAGVTRRLDLQNTLRDLRYAGANIVGTILADAISSLPGWAGGGGQLPRVKPGAPLHA
jgi:Mrp family chromosome partitioning ATPase